MEDAQKPLLDCAYRAGLPRMPDVELRQGSLAYRVGRSFGDHLNQQTKVLVKRDQWRSASLVGFQTYFDRFGPVIFSLQYLPLTAIAAARDFRRTLGHMENRFAFLAGPAAAQPSHDFACGQCVVHHRRQRESLAVHQLFQGHSLSQRARKSVEDEPTAAAQAINSLPNQLPHCGVRHQSAATHVFQSFFYGGALFAVAEASGSPENVTRGKMTGAQSLVQQIGLGTLAYPRCSQQNNSPGTSTLRHTFAPNRRPL